MSQRKQLENKNFEGLTILKKKKCQLLQNKYIIKIFSTKFNILNKTK